MFRICDELSFDDKTRRHFTGEDADTSSGFEKRAFR